VLSEPFIPYLSATQKAFLETLYGELIQRLCTPVGGSPRMTSYILSPTSVCARWPL
jgi:hypothetical protein